MRLHYRFEYFGELLEQTLSGLSYLMKKCPNDGFDIFYAKLQETALYFLYYSIIVSRQPPSVVIKCGEAENHRRSRFWFNTEIRLNSHSVIESIFETISGFLVFYF